MAAPWRDAFDICRTPYDARNTLSVPEEVISDGVTYARRNRLWVNALTGIIDGSTPAAGLVGEVKSAVQGTPQALTTATALSLAAITLSAGVWELMGAIGYTGNVATNVTAAQCCLHTTANTMVTTIDQYSSQILGGITAFNFLGDLNLVTPRFIVNTTGTPTWNVTARANFTVNGMSATGKIWARRVD